MRIDVVSIFPAYLDALDLSLPGQGPARISLGTILDFPHPLLEGSFGVWRKALAFLMSLPKPSPAVVEAVKGGIATLKSLAVRDRAFVKLDEAQGRLLVEQPGAGPLWARYYDAKTLKPVFGDRDKSLHDDVNDLSLERRNGYAWWGSWPAKTLQAYDSWLIKHPS